MLGTLGPTYLTLNHQSGPKLPTLRYTKRTRICEADVIDPVHARYQHKGTVIPILIVGEVDDCWEAYVAGGLKRIPKELVLGPWALNKLSIQSKEQQVHSSGGSHEGHRQLAEGD